MGQLTLSKDLNVITAEINSYKQVAGQAIFEIGNRLKHVKENDLVHGEWERWLESIGMSRSQATKLITVSEELNPNDSTWNQIGTQSLYLIATMSEEEREREYTVSSGEVKAVDEMTVRELEEAKRHNKELKEKADLSERALRKSESEKYKLSKQLEVERNKQPEVREIVKEVVPDEVTNEINHLKEMVRLSESSYKEAQRELEGYRLKDVNNFDEEEAERELKKLRFEAEKGVLRLTVRINKFLEEVASFGYMEGEVASSTDATRDTLEKSVDQLDSFIGRMRTVLRGRIEI